MQILLKLLRKLPPEIAHWLGLFGLRTLQNVIRLPVPRLGPAKAPAIQILPGKLAVASRLGVAAGFDKNAEVFFALRAFGFGFAEVGTVTPKPQAGNPRPRLWRMPNASLINHFGFNSVGVQAFRANLLRHRSRCHGFALLANLGKNRSTPNESAIEDYAVGVRSLSDVVDGFVFNLSSPNTPGLTNLQSTDFLEQIAGIVPIGKPTLVKFSPDLDDAQIRELCAFIREEPRISGAVLVNTSPRLARELHGFQQGGLSGAPLFERALACVGIAREALGPDKLLIGCGGVVSKLSAQRMRAAGADLIEMYTGFIYGGPRLVREIVESLER